MQSSLCSQYLSGSLGPAVNADESQQLFVKGTDAMSAEQYAEQPS